MKSFKGYLREELSVVDFPTEIFDGFSAEVSNKSTSKRTIIIVRSGDRDNDRDEILRRLLQLDVNDAKTVSSNSSVDPIDGTLDGESFRIFVKPKSGGMAETTLNASITELFPCIAFEKGQNPTTVESFMSFIHDVDVNTLECVGRTDIKAAEETINKADTSSKYIDKMNNAIGILSYLRELNSDKTISNVYWGYRAKPSGVPRNHPGDVFIKFQDKSILGVSLKAGGKKTKEPLLNTYVRKIFDSFAATRELDLLEKKVYDEVYYKISDEMPPIGTYDGGSNGKHKDRKKTEALLKEFNRTNSREYESYYDSYLSIMRDGIVSLFNRSILRTTNYIATEVLRDAPEVPTVVIKAVGTSYEEVTDTNELGVFLPQVTFVRAYPSSSSKQNWHIELKSGTDKLTMNMSIRTNKPGHAGLKKLGQFSLAVKYNGISTK